MKYNQQAVDDLLSPLRYVNLKDIDPNSINRIGEGVFPELTTLDHLSILDLVTKAYQAIHLPTLGHPIPQSTVLTNVTLTSSSDEVVVVTAAANEVIEILGIGVKSAADYETSGIQLNIRKNGDTQPIMNFAAFDASSQTAGCMIYGKVIKIAQGFVCPSPLYINGGDSLVITSNSIPNNDIILPVTYRKVVQ
jgi:hypothetical protein